MATVTPFLRLPAVSGTRPRRARRSVDLPAPLTPTRPMRSPGAELPGRRGRAARRSPTDDAWRPRGRRRPCRAAASRTARSSTPSRGGGSSAMSALAASMRNLRLARARGRAAAQPGELLAQQVVAALGASTRRDAVALGLGEHVRRVAAFVGVAPRRRRPPTSRVATASRNQRSWVIATSALPAGRCARCSASQATPSTSRWLVGSSSRSRSGSGDEQAGQREPAALAAGERADRGVEPADVRGARCRRAARSARRGCGRRRPTRARAGRRAPPGARWPRGSRASSWASTPMRSAAGVGDPAGVRRRSRPASTRSRVVLPPPLRPTTPMRSPVERRRGETPSSTCAVP